MWAVVGAELGEWGWRYTGVDTACLRALLEAGRARQEEGGGGIGRLWRARRSGVTGMDGAGCDGGGDVERGDELGGGGTSPTAARGHEVGLKFGSARAATAWAAWRAAAATLVRVPVRCEPYLDASCGPLPRCPRTGFGRCPAFGVVR